MSVLPRIVQAPMLTMFDTRHDLSPGSAVAGEFVGDHHARSGARFLSSLRNRRLAAVVLRWALHQDVEPGPMLVHSPPEPALLA
jgi:hypothetical protein